MKSQRARWPYLNASALVGALMLLTTPALSGDRGMYGNSPSRNMVSPARNLPDRWDVESGKGIKWSVPLGSETYGGPVAASGKVCVGTNNEGLRIPQLSGDKSVVICFDSRGGEFLWQATHDKLEQGRDVDWPLQGVCSTPLIEEGRLYYVNNRAELVCLDAEGFRDGENDGPFKSEVRSGRFDADVIWKLDMLADLKVVPHNQALSSPLSVGNLLFVGTSNGIDGDHRRVPSPQAPSFLAVDKRSGKVVWQDGSPGDRILDGQWSNPAYGVVKGVPQVVFAGGDGWVYSFRPQDGQLIWKFDASRDPESAQPPAKRTNIIATPVIHGGRVYLGIGNDPETGDGPGRLWAIDASGQGDISANGAVWSRGGDDFRLTLSTVAIHNGLLYASDLAGFFYCLDAETGKEHWSYDAFAAVWGSPLVADGKVYLADEDGDVAVLQAGTEKKLLGEYNMGGAILSSPAAEDGVLYIATRDRLFAITNQ